MDVRLATEGDIRELCELYLEFHEFHAERLPERLSSIRDSWESERTALAERIREIVGSPDAVILVTQYQGKIVGLSELHLCQDEETSTRRASRYCHLQSMFVLEPHRRSGVGRALLSASESWARSRSATEVRLDSWVFPEGPSEFYERCGYRPYRLSLARPLE